jgi:hypothetical protein
MATTVLGDDSVPKTKFQALAGELRLLKSGMADMQGRLDALLIEIGTELEQVCKAGEPTAQVLPDRQDVEDAVVVEVAPAIADSLPEAEAAAEAISIAEVAAVADEPVTEINPEQVAAGEVAPIETDPIDTIEVIEATVSPDVEIIDPTTAVAEVTRAETAEVVVPAEPVAETAETVQVAAIADSSETAPTTMADVVAESAAALPDNVVVLAERCAEPCKGRSVIARTARWAAAIVLIVMAAAIAATGTGFAGNGEFLTIKDVCAIASDVCSIVPGIP